MIDLDALRAEALAHADEAREAQAANLARIAQEKANAPKKKLSERKLPKFEANRDYAVAMEDSEREGATQGFADDAAYGVSAGMGDSVMPTSMNTYYEGAASENPSNRKGDKANAYDTFSKDTTRKVELRESKERTQEETIEAILNCVGSQNALREILCKMIRFCDGTVEYEDIEKYTLGCDEYVFSHVIQTPYAMIRMLKNCGAIVERFYDAAGEELTDERREQMTDDEFEDTIEFSTLTATPEGLTVVDMISPANRFATLLARRPHRQETFYKVLEFCLEPRSLAEVSDYITNTPGMALDQVQTHHTLAPDFYVDKMEKAGVLVWRGAWVATPEGAELLERHKAEAQQA